MFRAKLEQFMSLQVEIDTKTQVDRVVKQFITNIQLAAEESTPFNCGNNSHLISDNIQWRLAN